MDAKSIIAQLRQAEQQYDSIRPEGTKLIWAADYVAPYGIITRYEVYTHLDRQLGAAFCCRIGWSGLLCSAYPRDQIVEEMKAAGVWEEHYT